MIVEYTKLLEEKIKAIPDCDFIFRVKLDYGYDEYLKKYMDMAQKKIDELLAKIEKLKEWIVEEIEAVIEEIIEYFKPLIEWIEAKIKYLKKLITVPGDLKEVIEWIKTFIEENLLGPYGKLVKFLKEVTEAQMSLLLTIIKKIASLTSCIPTIRPILPKSTEIEIVTTKANETFTMTLDETYKDEEYNLIIDYGDGDDIVEITAYQEKIHHTFVTPGTYVARITGITPSLSFYGQTSLTKVFWMRELNLITANNMFAYCTNLVEIPASSDFAKCFSNVVSFNSMFLEVPKLENIPTLDTSSGIDFYGMFNGCTNITMVGALDTSNATNLTMMYAYCKKLLIVPTLNTTKCIDFTNMYLDCEEIEVIPTIIATEQVLFEGMFDGCFKLKGVVVHGCQGNISIANCSFEAPAIDAFYTGLGEVAGKIVTVTNNPGVGKDTPNIARDKGWVVQQ